MQATVHVWIRVPSAQEQGEGQENKFRDEDRDDSKHHSVADLPGLDAPKLAGKSASRDKQDQLESKPQRMPAVDLK